MAAVEESDPKALKDLQAFTKLRLVQHILDQELPLVKALLV
eukprot:gene9308-9473_t